MTGEVPAGTPPDPLAGPPPAIFLVGPTASGKGAVAYRVAPALGAEILSLDSMKVYRGLDAGTNKPSREQRAAVPTHLVDHVEAFEDYSVDRFRDDALRICGEIRVRARRPLFVGGTPLYLRAMLSGLFEGPSANRQLRDSLERESREAGLGSLHRRLREIDPDSAARIHPNDARRIIRAIEVFESTRRPISAHQTQWKSQRGDVIVVGLRRDREDLAVRIEERVRRLFERGLVEETRRWLGDPRGLSRTAAQALGTKQVAEALNRSLGVDEAERLTVRETKRFARQQLTWFRRFAQIMWIDVLASDTADTVSAKLLSAIRGEDDRLAIVTEGKDRPSRN